jgi:hypothetical protein
LKEAGPWPEPDALDAEFPAEQPASSRPAPHIAAAMVNAVARSAARQAEARTMMFMLVRRTR